MANDMTARLDTRARKVRILGPALECRTPAHNAGPDVRAATMPMHASDDDLGHPVHASLALADDPVIKVGKQRMEPHATQLISPSGIRWFAGSPPGGCNDRTIVSCKLQAIFMGRQHMLGVSPVGPYFAGQIGSPAERVLRVRLHGMPKWVPFPRCAMRRACDHASACMAAAGKNAGINMSQGWTSSCVGREAGTRKCIPASSHS